MTFIYILIIVLQIGVIIYFIRRGRRQNSTGMATAIGDTYEGNRNLALSITPSQLKLLIPDSSLLVYGVIMDWNMGDTVVTLAAYITGASAMYISTGGGVKNAGDYPDVCEAAVAFVVTAQDHIDRAIPTTATDLPPNGCVRFYLLTNKGRYAAQDSTKHFDDTSSPWLDLFTKGNEVVGEMRQYSSNGI